MHVYILRSEKIQRFYCGQTTNLNDRIKRHNSGRSKHTKHGVPWDIIHVIEVPHRSDAIKLETKIKKRGIKRYLEDCGVISK